MTQRQKEEKQTKPPCQFQRTKRLVAITRPLRLANNKQTVTPPSFRDLKSKSKRQDRRIRIVPLMGPMFGTSSSPPYKDRLVLILVAVPLILRVRPAILKVLHPVL